MTLDIRLMKPEETIPVVKLWRRSRDEALPELEARMGYSHEDDLNDFRDQLWFRVTGVGDRDLVLASCLLRPRAASSAPEDRRQKTEDCERTQ